MAKVPTGKNRNKATTGIQLAKQVEVIRPETIPQANEPVLLQTKEVDNQVKSNNVPTTDLVPVNPLASEQVAGNTAKPITKPATERVLEVTIDEPATLVAARQAVKASMEEKPMVANNDQPEKETKAGGLWQQVKRFKQGELFAHRDNANNDERGLLSRAYNGLKHSLDKDKEVKQ